MFKVEDNIKYYLYDKDSNTVIKTFDSIYQIRKFLKNDIALLTGHDKYGITPHLSMCLESFVHDYVIYPDLSIGDVKIDRYVIIDSKKRIFNYRELYYEMNAEKNNWDIHFGVGKTYAGPSKIAKAYSIVYSNQGFKSHPRGSGSRYQCIKLREVRQTADVIIEEELGVDFQILKKAYCSMRGKRKDLIGCWRSHATLANTECWKNKKCKKQWQKNK